MFTVRIEHGPPGARRVVTCAAYEVTVIGEGVRLELEKPDEETVAVEIGSRGCAYVMNDAGVTIDVIRPGRKAAKR
jgi:hypothetical protein